MKMEIVQNVEKNMMKMCKKCDGPTYSDDAKKCSECDTTLSTVDPGELMGIEKNGV